MLIMWTGGAAAAPFDDQAVLAERDSWRQDLGGRGLHVLGERAGQYGHGHDVRVRDGETLLGHGPFTTTKGFIAGIDVLSCADRRQAIQLVAAHPIARYQALEVRPFYKE